MDRSDSASLVLDHLGTVVSTSKQPHSTHLRHSSFSFVACHPTIVNHILSSSCSHLRLHSLESLSFPKAVWIQTCRKWRRRHRLSVEGGRMGCFLFRAQDSFGKIKRCFKPCSVFGSENHGVATQTCWWRSQGTAHDTTIKHVCVAPSWSHGCRCAVFKTCQGSEGASMLFAGVVYSCDRMLNVDVARWVELGLRCDFCWWSGGCAVSCCWYFSSLVSNLSPAHPANLQVLRSLQLSHTFTPNSPLLSSSNKTSSTQSTDANRCLLSSLILPCSLAPSFFASSSSFSSTIILLVPTLDSHLLTL